MCVCKALPAMCSLSVCMCVWGGGGGGLVWGGRWGTSGCGWRFNGVSLNAFECMSACI